MRSRQDLSPVLCLALALAACSTPSQPTEAPPDAPPDASTSAPAASAPPAGGSASATAPAPVSEPGLALGTDAKHACYLEGNGDLRCWGSNDRGQIGVGRNKVELSPVLVRDLGPVAQAAPGAGHTCALLRDGAVKCWGDDMDPLKAAAHAIGRLEVKGLGDVKQIVSASGYSCALNAAHEVHCWGQVPGSSDPALTPRRIPGVEATRIAAAKGAACALRTSGAIACWGDNTGNRISPKGPEYINEPRDMEDVGEGVTDVVMSDNATCGLLGAHGKALCLGRPHFYDFRPEEVWRLEGASTISGGGRGHFCSLLTDGNITCWGEPRSPALGGERYSSSNTIAGKFVEVRAGFDFTCARTQSGEVRCWGFNDSGQLAQEFVEGVAHPSPLAGVAGARAIAAGPGTTCAVLQDHRVRCWGPDPSEASPEEVGPRDLKAIVHADDLAMGGGIQCALTDGIPTCWGDNRASQLPTVNAVHVPEPSTLGSLRGPKAFVFGAEHACSLAEDGSVQCWGGRGKTRTLPTAIRGVKGAASIAIGDDEACALLADGTVTCWPLRDPPAGATIPERYLPAKVAGVRGATAIGHGKRHACAALAAGGVTCWSGGAAPAKVEGIDSAADLALGDDFSCARRKDGTVACWGSNGFGQLGDGSLKDRATSAPVDGLTDVVSLRAGPTHACALTKKGEIHCWGDNRARQIEQGSPLVSRLPLLVTVKEKT